MARSAGRFLRDNAFLVAAVALPIVVVVFFLLFTAIPRWTVPPPGYDLLLRTTSFDQAGPRVAVDLTVQHDRVEATLRPLAAHSAPQRVTLWLFDHASMNVRQVPLDLPDLAGGESSRTVVLGALAGRRVLAQTKAPDGYEFRAARGSPGLVGDLFGMRRYDQAVSIVNRGRVVPIDMPSPYEYQAPVFVGWVVDEGTR